MCILCVYIYFAQAKDWSDLLEEKLVEEGGR